jgi:hypothetical protein
MEEQIWTYGEKPEKSYKKPAPEKLAPEKPASITMTDLDINIGELRMSSNKRDQANNKLNDRELVGQVGQNPFHTSNNYLNDLEVQRNFLTPKSSN